MKILIAEPLDFSKQALDILAEVGYVECNSIQQVDLKNALQSFDVIWIRLGLNVRKNDISAKLRCRYIISATTGLNHLDVSELELADIKVLSLKGHTQFLESIKATAEHTIGLILSLVRNIPAAHFSAISCEWNRDNFKGNEIAGKTIGIVGYGRLGKIVAKFCEALNMKIVIYDPYVDNKECEYLKLDKLHDLLLCSDFVSLHVPLNTDTNKMIDRQMLSFMKSNAYLINTARGEVIDEVALMEVLVERKIAGAALDVLCNEEFLATDNTLFEYARNNRNLIITPHIGGCTWESMEKCEIYMAKVLLNDVKKGLQL